MNINKLFFRLHLTKHLLPKIWFSSLKQILSVISNLICDFLTDFGQRIKTGNLYHQSQQAVVTVLLLSIGYKSLVLWVKTSEQRLERREGLQKTDGRQTFPQQGSSGFYWQRQNLVQKVLCECCGGVSMHSPDQDCRSMVSEVYTVVYTDSAESMSQTQLFCNRPSGRSGVNNDKATSSSLRK